MLLRFIDTDLLCHAPARRPPVALPNRPERGLAGACKPSVRNLELLSLGRTIQ